MLAPSSQAPLMLIPINQVKVPYGKVTKVTTFSILFL
jgi:hypothetical protein